MFPVVLLRINLDLDLGVVVIGMEGLHMVSVWAYTLVMIKINQLMIK